MCVQETERGVGMDVHETELSVGMDVQETELSVGMDVPDTELSVGMDVYVFKRGVCEGGCEGRLGMHFFLLFGRFRPFTF